MDTRFNQSKFSSEGVKMEEKIEKIKFVKLPIDEETDKEQKEFEEMLGHIYIAYYS